MDAEIQSRFRDSEAKPGVQHALTHFRAGVWTTGWAGHAHSVAVLREQHRDPALASSSPLTILTYDVDERFGGNVALVNLRLRAHAVGLRVVVDFVVNHMARDHAYV